MSSAPNDPSPQAPVTPPPKPDDELTPARREAIREYMLKSVTPAGVVLAIVSFILGFFVNEVARKQAYETAFTQMTKKVDDVSGKASRRVDDLSDRASNSRVLLEVSNERTTHAREQIEKNTAAVEEMSSKVRAIAGQVESAKIFELVRDKQDEFVAALAKDPKFIEKIAQVTYSPDLSGTYTPYYSEGMNRGLITRAVAIIKKKGDVFEIQWFDDKNMPGATAMVRYVEGKPGELSADSFVNYEWGMEPKPPRISGRLGGSVVASHIWWYNGEHWVKATPRAP